MFSPVECFERNVYIEAKAMTAKWWSAIRVELNRPWFYVVAERTATDAEKQECYLLASREDLTRFLRESAAELSIIQLNVIGRDKESCWHMHELKTIWTLQSKNSPEPFDLFISSQGEEFYEGDAPTEPALWHLVFSKNQQRCEGNL